MNVAINSTGSASSALSSTALPTTVLPSTAAPSTVLPTTALPTTAPTTPLPTTAEPLCPKLYGAHLLKNTTETSVGTVVGLGCEEGFVLPGDSWIRCDPGGVWNANFPFCQSKPCQDFRANHLIVNNTNTTFGSLVGFKCEGGRELTGASWMKCEEGGIWSAGIPQCISRGPINQIGMIVPVSIAAVVAAVILVIGIYMLCTNLRRNKKVKDEEKERWRGIMEANGFGSREYEAKTQDAVGMPPVMIDGLNQSLKGGPLEDEDSSGGSEKGNLSDLEATLKVVDDKAKSMLF